MRATISCSAAASQSSTFIETWTSRALGRSRPSARTPGEPAAALAHDRGDRARDPDVSAQVDVEGDQRPARADDHPAGRLVQARRPEVGRELARVDTPLQLGRPAAPVEGRAALGRRVHEHGEPELGADPLRRRLRRGARALQILRTRAARSARRRLRRCAGALPRGCAGRSARRRPRSPASSASPSSVSVPTSVKTERLWSGSACTSSRRACAPSADPIASIVARSRPSLKFGTDSSGSTVRTLGAVKEYYDRRAPEYDDWWLGAALFAGRERPGWEAELDEVAARLAALPPARTLDIACGTGFITQTSSRRRRRPRPERRRCSRSPASAFHGAEFVVGRRPRAALPERELRACARELLLLPPRGAGAAPLPRRGAPRRARADRLRQPPRRRRTSHAERWEERVLQDGSRWPVFKRVFEPEALAGELGGEVLHAGRWFVVVCSTT